MRKSTLPHMPAEYDDAIQLAVDAFSRGKATEQQQLIAYRWIVYAVAEVDGLSYRHGGEEMRRASDFADGKKYVGQQIRKMSHPLTMEALKNKAQSTSTEPKPRGKPNETE